MNPLTDAQLLAYIDGEAPPEVVREIERSDQYQKRIHQLSQLEHRLRASLARASCPDALELGEYHLQFVTAQRGVEIRRHLQVCPHCSAELDQLRQFLTSQPSPAERVRKVIAELLSMGGDTSQMRPALAPAFGLRGSMEPPRMYQAEGAQIILDFQPEPQSSQMYTLIGLFIGPDPAGRTVEVVAATGEATKTEVDELGNFMISGVMSGEYFVRIFSDQEEIQIPALTVP